ncbi:hypothetical protein [Psychrobacter sp. LV10R520-6]|uniref:hypothetical protein n=1 Tax=Psychrobacter sp. LV10R520-6 TaxID=1415574 RepID=UPI0024C76BFF|nr:hypothetical protein [Psychrobacter sp. LV10R520-6]SNT71181.1 hypothetical protein SAMN04488491_2408 [Psychrobacter sp. LV10R520-6]
MDKPQKDMDKQEQKIQQLAEDINPSEDVFPDSEAEATTVPLADDELGGNATQDDVKKNK